MLSSPLSRLGRWVVFLVWAAVLGCATQSHRDPASSLPPPFQEGLVPYAQKMLEHISAPEFDSDECMTYLRIVQSDIPQIRPRDASEQLSGHAQELVDLLWKTRLALHRRLPDLSADCVTEIRNTARLFRFIEDLLAERAGNVQDLDPSKMDFSRQEDIPVISNSPNYLKLTNPDFGNFEFKNGDVMIARGVSFLSAIISRIGDVSSQFSHVILVHVDKDTHQVETIESYVGPGVGLYGINDALKNENVRLMLLRPKDQDLAAKAADAMYARVKSALAAGHPIPYDYKFDFKDHSALSCAEVAEAAYESASDGKVILPYYPSHISEDPKFLKRIGMQPGTTFTPGDLEVDPRFDLVMEWRDLRLTRDERVKDSILTSMLNWVHQDGYQLHDTLTADFDSSVVWLVRQTPIWPMLQKIFKLEDFPNGIPHHLFKTMVLLNQVGSAFLKHMKVQDANFEKKTGWPMTYQDLYKSLDDYRAQDWALYQNPETRQKSEFHFAFHP